MIIFIIVLINLSIIFSQDFQNFIPNILEEDSDLLEVKDYENIGLIITTKKLYSRLNFQYPSTFPSEFPSNAVFATYDESYILTACTSNNLLGKFSESSLVEESIYSYSLFSLSTTNRFCSISYLSPNAFIVYSKRESSKINLTVVKIKLKMLTNGPIYDDSPAKFNKEITFYTKSYKHISCEAIFSVDSYDKYALITTNNI